jgi:hypothetical protein
VAGSTRRLLGFAVGVLALAMAASARADAPRALGLLRPHAAGARAALRLAVAPAGALAYHGGDVMATSTVYVLYWDPAGTWTSPYGGLIETYLRDVEAAGSGSDSVYALARTYAGRGGEVAGRSTTYGGSYHDTARYPATCSTPAARPCVPDTAIQAEVARVGNARGWIHDRSALVLVLLPPSTGVCVDAVGACAYTDFCAYHSWTGDRRVYATIPYLDGLPPGQGCTTGSSPNANPAADMALDAISHEHIEALTDPFGDGWFEPASGNEIADMCVDAYGTALGVTGSDATTSYNQAIGTGRYWLQTEWSNRASACMQRGERPPSPPTDVTAVPEGGGAVISFTPPIPSGIATSYRVSAPGLVDRVVLASPVVVAGLVDGTSVRFSVTAEDALGASLPAPADPVVIGGRPAPVPGVPTATRLVGAVSIAFPSTPDDGGAPLTGYAVAVQPGARVVSGPASPIVVDGLQNGTAYTFSVVAINGIGRSRPTSSLSGIVPLGPPPTPIGSAVAAGNALRIRPALPLGPLAPGIYRLDVVVSPGDHHASTSQLVGAQLLVTGLTPGVPYTTTIVAVNGYGSSGPVTLPAATPYGVPGPPQGPVATVASHELDLAFVPPAGPEPVASYHVQLLPGPIDVSTTSPSATIRGLRNGVAYSVAVAAVNDAGESTILDAGMATPVGPPEAPTAPVLVGGVRSLRVAFTAGSDGGSPTDGYVITLSPGPIVVHALGSPVVVTGLRDGTRYAVSVLAHSGLGTSTALAAGSAATVARAAAPTHVRARARGRLVTVTFRAPANGAAARVATYRVVAALGRRRVAVTVRARSARLVLGPGRWVVRVLAEGAAGDGARSGPVHVVVQ